MYSLFRSRQDREKAFEDWRKKRPGTASFLKKCRVFNLCEFFYKLFFPYHQIVFTALITGFLVAIIVAITCPSGEKEIIYVNSGSHQPKATNKKKPSVSLHWISAATEEELNNSEFNLPSNQDGEQVTSSLEDDNVIFSTDYFNLYCSDTPGKGIKYKLKVGLEDLAFRSFKTRLALKDTTNKAYVKVKIPGYKIITVNTTQAVPLKPIQVPMHTQPLVITVQQYCDLDSEPPWPDLIFVNPKLLKVERR